MGRKRGTKRSEPNIERALRDGRRRNLNMQSRRRAEGFDALKRDFPTRFAGLMFFSDEEAAAWVRDVEGG